MKPNHIRTAGAIAAIALVYQAARYWRIKWTLGIGVLGLAIICYGIMEWLARAEQAAQEGAP